MTYPPQQGQQPYGGYPQQQGPHGGPPPKDKAPLIASLIFVVALLAGLGITGFVAPGFFLSDDDKGGGSSADGGATGDGDDTGSPGSGAGKPTQEGRDADLRAFAADLVAAANAKDKTALREFPCPDAASGVNQAIAEIVTIDGAELSGVSEVDAETYVVGIDITFHGESAPFAATVTKSGDGWCWQDFAPGSGGAGAPEPGAGSDDPADGPGGGAGGSPVDAGEAETFAGEFVAALNAKDGDKANGMYCPDAITGVVDEVVGKDADLTLGTSMERGPQLEVLLKGTLDRNPLKRGKVMVEMENSDAPCVFSFSAG